MGPGCESGSRFFCRRLSRIMDRMDKTIEHNEQAAQVETAAVYADAARASDAEGFNREDAERTLSLTVSYNGGPFCGFARQPGKLTVQGELEQALSMVMRRQVEVVCSGRTDAGVHALGQARRACTAVQPHGVAVGVFALKLVEQLAGLVVASAVEHADDFGHRLVLFGNRFKYIGDVACR